MTDILNIASEPIFDDRIVKIETHTYNLYANTTFAHSDEIRIPIQQQDLYTLPWDSFLYVEGRLTLKKKDDDTPTTLENNCVAFMFDEIPLNMLLCFCGGYKRVVVNARYTRFHKDFYGIDCFETLLNVLSFTVIRCGHADNCSLQNVFKMFNWSRRQKEL
ncbi:hypothetical protein ALC60_09504 [Trachymyrmex zeteki]|uniref:Uncharacterized protein n=1 Tax=Mycetomoellerius zeteki TaxID=64791 RepID=A0A151WU81_9HYME|nr:hypothetical protein ALC60_09504 [Trachymyrmex zeteki]